MHICYIQPPDEFYSPTSGGAVATVNMQQARQLIARGHTVSVICPESGDETYEAGHVIPIEIKSRKTLGLLRRRLSHWRGELHGWDLPYYDHYRRHFLEALRNLPIKPDVVILNNDLVSPKYIKRAMRDTRTIVWLHNEWRTRQRDMRETIAAVDQFVGVSGYIRDWTAQRYGLGSGKVSSVSNGVDLEAFSPRPDFLESDELLRVLYIGRIDPNKGPDIAADAVAALKREGLPIHFTTAGAIWFHGYGNQTADPYFRTLKVKLDAVGADYMGHVSRQDVPALIRSHDVVCVLSRSNEPFALVALEAMASGCAVIASDRGGLPEACGGAALLVNPDDLDSVVARLRALATDHAFLKEQKKKSIARAAKASWSAAVDELEKLLNVQSRN